MTATIATSIGSATVLHRLALGVECFDGIGGNPVTTPVRCGREVVDRMLPRRRELEWPCIDLDRATAARFVLRHDRALPDPAVIRLDDPKRRFVPRRFAVHPWSIADLDEENPVNQYVPVGSRVLRTWLLPGVAYGAPSGSTAVRGTVRRADGSRVRWCRLRAVSQLGNDAGWAHADERGEFLLIVTSIDWTQQETVFPVDITVSAPPPEAADPDDRCADLPIEDVPRSSVPPLEVELDNPVLRGTTAPATYLPNTNPPTHVDVPIGGELILRADIVVAP